jgi:hypothetical protein
MQPSLSQSIINHILQLGISIHIQPRRGPITPPCLNRSSIRSLSFQYQSTSSLAMDQSNPLVLIAHQSARSVSNINPHPASPWTNHPSLSYSLINQPDRSLICSPSFQYHQSTPSVPKSIHIQPRHGPIESQTTPSLSTRAPPSLSLRHEQDKELPSTSPATREEIGGFLG